MQKRRDAAHVCVPASTKYTHVAMPSPQIAKRLPPCEGTSSTAAVKS